VLNTDKPRSIIMFEESIKSPKTLNQYKKRLEKFLEWSHKDYESLLLLPSEQLQVLIEDYVFFLKKGGLGFSAINLDIAAIKKFLLVSDREIKMSKIRMLLPEQRKAAGQKSYTVEQIQKMLEFADTLRNKALIHCLAAGGFRAGAFEELKVKHLEEMPDNCYAATVYAESKHEYITFLHHEARKALDEYLEFRQKNGELVTQESYLFQAERKKLFSKPKPISSQAVDDTIFRIIKKAGIVRTKQDGSNRYDISACNGFRKRYNTILKSNPQISFAIAERMMDHSTYLEPIYLDTSDKVKFFAEYRKAIPDLIIDKSERLRLQNRLKDETIKKMESEKDSRIAQLENDMVVIKKLLMQNKKSQQL